MWQCGSSLLEYLGVESPRVPEMRRSGVKTRKEEHVAVSAVGNGKWMRTVGWEENSVSVVFSGSRSLCHF